MSSRSVLPLAIALILSITACGDDPAGPEGNPDTIPPAITGITTLDNSHFEVTFNEQLTENSAQDRDHYLLLRVGALSGAASLNQTAPGDSIDIEAAVLKADNRTVAISTYDPASGVSMILTVDGVADLHGNEINHAQKTFMGSTFGDVNAPVVVRVSPAAGATGASIGTPVVVQFSEPLDYASVYNGVTWTSGSTPVIFYLELEGATLTLNSFETLPYNMRQTIALPGTIKDRAGNALAATQWSFMTTSIVDNTPPVVVSTSPPDRATRVNVSANIVVTFSEAMNQHDLGVDLEPWVGAGGGAITWSTDGKTLTIDPLGQLADDQQYVLTIPPGGVRDLAGNTNVQGRVAVFTTGPALESGNIAGVIEGDPGSAADDPTGAIVTAETDTTNYFRYTLVAPNDTYAMFYLPDNSYYLYAYMDTNGDNRFDPYTGDAVGAYGVDLSVGDEYLDPVVITGGSHESGINFPIYDPTAIIGTVTYAGVDTEAEVFIGLFKVAGFNPSNPVNPVAYYGGWMASYGVDFFLNSIVDEFPDGDYYLFAYMNLNGYTSYEPGVDAAGMYGGLARPTVLHVRNGNDFLNIRFAVEDPRVASNSPSVSWPAQKQNAGFKRLCDRIKQSQMRSTR
jgi:hypothetical protein